LEFIGKSPPREIADSSIQPILHVNAQIIPTSPLQRERDWFVHQPAVLWGMSLALEVPD
jgi:hypothetical protein